MYKTELITLILFALLSLFPPPLPAEDYIRVLMIEDPSGPLPSGKPKVIDHVKGKVFIKGQFYSGNIEIMKYPNGLYIVNNLPFEEYIEGVVASETGKEWEIEALKAQAVISRTYAAFYKNQNGNNGFHLTSSILHQVYKGKNTDPVVAYAVKETSGEILTFGSMPIKAFFHATCEGKTELPEEIWEESFPYLTSVDCNGQNAPYGNWQRKFSLKTITDALGTGDIEDLVISSYTASGRVKTLRVVPGEESSEKGDTIIRGTELRKVLGYTKLPSTQFSLTRKGENMIFRGQGYGHGVGLSQWGALEMARQGKTYREILSHYYPGTELKNRAELMNRELASRISP